jgi:uncharacterized protein
MTKNEAEKLERLKKIISQFEHLIVAYSGGVDSTFLLKVAYDVLGNNAQGVLAVSPTYPSWEYDAALSVAREIGVTVTTISTQETELENFLKNPTNRCYFCKSELFSRIAEYVEHATLTIADGSNFDDLGDHRPGMKALREKGVRSPLQEAELTKSEIRSLSKELGLPTWNKDALACLSSRFPYGERIDLKKLNMVDQAENFLLALGFSNLRARHQQKTVKIELPPDQIPRLLNDVLRKKIVDKMKKIGYTYVTLDLEGYRQGSMNENVKTQSAVDPSQLNIAKH